MPYTKGDLERIPGGPLDFDLHTDAAVAPRESLNTDLGAQFTTASISKSLPQSSILARNW